MIFDVRHYDPDQPASPVTWAWQTTQSKVDKQINKYLDIQIDRYLDLQIDRYLDLQMDRF